MQKPFMINIFSDINFHKCIYQKPVTNVCIVYKMWSFRVIYSKGRNKMIKSYNYIVLKVLPIAAKWEKIWSMGMKVREDENNIISR